MPRWLVTRLDGTSPRVMQATDARGALLERQKDDHDTLQPGDVACVWRLGNFPAQYVVVDGEWCVVERRPLDV